MWVQSTHRNSRSGDSGWRAVSAELRIPRPRLSKYHENPVAQRISRASLVEVQVSEKKVAGDKDKMPLAALVAKREKALNSHAGSRYEEPFYWSQLIAELYPHSDEAGAAWITMIELFLDGKFGRDILPDWQIVEVLIEMHSPETPCVKELLKRILDDPDFKQVAKQMDVIGVLQPVRFS